MKKKYVVVIMLSIFLLTEAESAEDVSNDASLLQSEVNRTEDAPNGVPALQVTVNRLEAKIKLLEKELNKIQDAYQTTKANKGSILNLVSRLEIVEKKQEESSDETINTLKGAVADLRKMLEDQDITMGIFEKKYNISQKPLEPLEKSIKDQTKTISKIIVKLDEQERMIKSLSENTGIQITASKTIQKYLDNEDVLGQLPDAEADIRISNFLNEGNHHDIGGGFYAKELMFEPFGTSVKLSGVILNASERDVNVVNLKIYIHDNKDDSVWDHEFRITGFKRSDTTSFSEILTTGIKMNEMGKFALVSGTDAKPTQFINLKSDSVGEKEVRVIKEKQESREEITNKDVEPVQIATSTATYRTRKEIAEKTPKDEQMEEVLTPTATNLAKKKNIEEKPKDEQVQESATSIVANLAKKETIEEPPKDEQIQKEVTEEFEDVGGGFFVNNVTITAIDSGVELSGILKNSSGNFHTENQFLVKFFDKEKKLVHMYNFTVSGIADKSTVEFSETVTGIIRKDFDSYKIKFLGK